MRIHYALALSVAAVPGVLAPSLKTISKFLSRSRSHSPEPKLREWLESSATASDDGSAEVSDAGVVEDADVEYGNGVDRNTALSVIGDSFANDYVWDCFEPHFARGMDDEYVRLVHTKSASLRTPCRALNRAVRFLVANPMSELDTFTREAVGKLSSFLMIYGRSDPVHPLNEEALNESPLMLPSIAKLIDSIYATVPHVRLGEAVYDWLNEEDDMDGGAKGMVVGGDVEGEGVDWEWDVNAGDDEEDDEEFKQILAGSPATTVDDSSSAPSVHAEPGSVRLELDVTKVGKMSMMMVPEAVRLVGLLHTGGIQIVSEMYGGLFRLDVAKLVESIPEIFSEFTEAHGTWIKFRNPFRYIANGLEFVVANSQTLAESDPVRINLVLAEIGAFIKLLLLLLRPVTLLGTDDDDAHFNAPVVRMIIARMVSIDELLDMENRRVPNLGPFASWVESWASHTLSTPMWVKEFWVDQLSLISQNPDSDDVQAQLKYVREAYFDALENTGGDEILVELKNLADAFYTHRDRRLYQQYGTELRANISQTLARIDELTRAKEWTN